MNSVVEIERRFLTAKPDWRKLVDEATKAFIKQGYPDSIQDEGCFGRVRSTYDPHTKNTTYEEGNKGVQVDLATKESEWEITSKRFEELWLEAGSQTLDKWRWFLLSDGVEFYVDQFTHIRHDRSTLVISEVEFETVEAAKLFQPPSWVGEEITGDHRWSNFSLCTHGEPALVT